MQKFRDLPWGKFFWLFLAFLFANFMAWSVLYETLLPLWRSGNMPAFYRNLIGIPLLFIGLGVFVYSAFRFLRDTFRVTNSSAAKVPEKEITRDHRGEPDRATKDYPLSPLLKAWLPSILLFLLSVILFAIGGRLTN